MSELYHLVRPPRVASERPPVLVFLHGYGSHEEDLFGLAEDFSPEFFVVSVRAPLSAGPGGFAWFPVDFTPEGLIADEKVALNSRERLEQLLEVLPERYQTDPRRVLAVGFSQGAIMAASVALASPESLGAAVLMSGRILESSLVSAAPLSRLSQTSYLIVHGTKDRVLPVENGRKSRLALEKLGLQPQYQEYEMEHTISKESLELVTTWSRRWLENHL